MPSPSLHPPFTPFRLPTTSHGGRPLARACAQVFFNLGELRGTAEAEAAAIAATIRQAIVSAFDPAVFGVEAAQKLKLSGGVLGDLGGGGASKDGMPPPSSVGPWRELLWRKAEGMAEELFASVLRLLSLHRVLTKKRDPLSQLLFSSLLFSDGLGRPLAEQGPPPPLAGAMPTAPTSLTAAAGGGSAFWPEANTAVLAASPALAALVDAPAPVAAAGGGAAAAAGVADGTGGEGLRLLWAPLPPAVDGAVKHACSASPFVRSTLAAELPRLLELLTTVEQRVASQIAPAMLPVEASEALSADAMLRSLPDARDGWRKVILDGLYRTIDEQLRAVADGAIAAHESDDAPPRRAEGRPGAAAAAAAAPRLGQAIERVMGGVEKLPPLQLVAAAVCAQAIELFAVRIEGLLRYDDAGAAAIAHASRVNGELLTAVWELRVEVSSQLRSSVPEAACNALRQGLAKLAPVCTALANPSTPLSEAKRADSATMLKQVLRRELIDEQ